MHIYPVAYNTEKVLLHFALIQRKSGSTIQFTMRFYPVAKPHRGTAKYSAIKCLVFCRIVREIFFNHERNFKDDGIVELAQIEAREFFDFL